MKGFAIGEGDSRFEFQKKVLKCDEKEKENLKATMPGPGGRMHRGGGQIIRNEGEDS